MLLHQSQLNTHMARVQGIQDNVFIQPLFHSIKMNILQTFLFKITKDQLLSRYFNKNVCRNVEPDPQGVMKIKLDGTSQFLYVLHGRIEDVWLSIPNNYPHSSSAIVMQYPYILRIMQKIQVLPVEFLICLN